MRLEATQRTDLAKRAIDALDRAGRGLKGPDLAGRIGTTIHYLPHVMRPLVTSGWVTSEPGPAGGYRLDPSAQAGTMLELIEAVEGPIDDGKCVLHHAACPSPEPCALHETWSRARDVMAAELRAVPLLDHTGTPGGGTGTTKGGNQ